LILLACGSATDTGPTRYNFAIVDGLNQSSPAGTPTLAKPITSQLTRDPQGKFATRVFDFFAPAIAYAQTLVLPGEPVAGQLVCGEETGDGEPKIVPLCAFTLVDGKAANSVQVGTKAGVYTMRFTAQITTEMPVKDSTTVTVLPGPAASHRFNGSLICWTVFPADYVKDQYGNLVPYRMLTTGPAAHVVSDVMGSEGARTFVVDAEWNLPDNGPGQAVTVEVATGVIATGEITTTSISINCVWLQF